MRRYQYLAGALATICVIYGLHTSSAMGRMANSDELAQAQNSSGISEEAIPHRRLRRERRLREKQMYPVPQNVKILHALSYVPGSEDSEQQLDLYLPPQASKSKVPLVVWIHGGGWRFGDRSIKDCEPLLGMGIAIAGISYRLTDKAILAGPNIRLQSRPTLAASARQRIQFGS